MKSCLCVMKRENHETLSRVSKYKRAGRVEPSPFPSKHVKRLIRNTKSTESNTSLRCRHYRTRWCLGTKVDPLALSALRQWARGTHYFQYVYV